MTKKIAEGEVIELDITEIIPYWKNARKSTNVEMVKRSIEEYGYNSYIVVDAGNVIIAGHSRYKALLELGWKKVKVIKTTLSEHEAKKYRLLDNKIQEENEWDESILELELRDIGDDDFIVDVFDVDFDDMRMSNFENADVTMDDIDDQQGSMGTRFQERSDERQTAVTTNQSSITCPHCYKTFNVA